MVVLCFLAILVLYGRTASGTALVVSPAVRGKEATYASVERCKRKGEVRRKGAVLSAAEESMVLYCSLIA
ncbi:hypothetical protein E3N88_10354 [Mikania micrantha]|uniref:Secreted protein n=1 Tax=Mikania micrantha TaxID=192012 RepID=A0A5N6PAK1_9ASTR|nr:hypothetical protein E3N88_10354 [Mikania micrantha]